MNLLEEIEEHPICGDGSIETTLIDHGVPKGQCVEELCLSRPELIRVLHRQYVAAGARIIGTNTFGANAVHLAPHGLADRVNEINWQGGQLARQSASGEFIAGGVGPLGVSSATALAQGIDREECFRTQIGALLDSGVDLIFFKNFKDLEELLLALRVKHSLHHCPAICSLLPNEHGQLPDGMSLEDAFVRLAQAEADILAINDVGGPEETVWLLQRLPRLEAPLAAFPSVGRSRGQKDSRLDGTSLENFAKVCPLMISAGVRIIGGGFGTTPAHIAELASAFRGARRERRGTTLDEVEPLP